MSGLSHAEEIGDTFWISLLKVIQLLNGTGAMSFLLNKANIYDESQQGSSWLLLFN